MFKGGNTAATWKKPCKIVAACKEPGTQLKHANVHDDNISDDSDSEYESDEYFGDDDSEDNEQEEVVLSIEGFFFCFRIAIRKMNGLMILQNRRLRITHRTYRDVRILGAKMEATSAILWLPVVRNS
ncbi:hypothetical protein Gotur_028406 [Gossypium turneri]